MAGLAGLVRVTIGLLGTSVIISRTLRATAVSILVVHNVVAVLWRLAGARALIGNKAGRRVLDVVSILSLGRSPRWDGFAA